MLIFSRKAVVLMKSILAVTGRNDFGETDKRRFQSAGRGQPLSIYNAAIYAIGRTPDGGPWRCAESNGGSTS